MSKPVLGFLEYEIVSAVAAAEEWCKITGQTAYVVAHPIEKGKALKNCALTVLIQEQLDSLKLSLDYTVRYCTT